MNRERVPAHGPSPWMDSKISAICMVRGRIGGGVWFVDGRVVGLGVSEVIVGSVCV